MRSQSHNAVSLLDRRWAALAKQEMIEHQHIISCHHKEMQELRDSLRLSTDRFESLSQRMAAELKDFKTHAVCAMDTMNANLSRNDRLIAEQKKTIEDLHKQLLNFQSDYVTCADMDKMRMSLAHEVKSNTEINLEHFQCLEREFKDSVRVLENDLSKLRSELEGHLALLEKKSESNFHISRIDRDGVLKEIRTYEKTVFIIEKKIENLYTLVERLTKRGEQCHKPE